MSFTPIHLRHVPFGWRSHSTQTMTMRSCVRTILPKSLSDYQYVDIDGDWSFEEQDTHAYSPNIMGEV